MSSIVTSVLNATIGWLVAKGRDMTAEKLKEGDVTDQKIHDLIVREVKDIKTKLDGITRNDLLRADVSKYRPEVYKSEKSKILQKIHKVALRKLFT